MLVDNFGRKIDYIRVSITSRCNFRCIYCMPNTPKYDKEDILTYEEMFEFLKIAIDEGIKKIRITGGEPLIRKDLDKFIKMLYSYKPSLDLALTTNGYYLKKYAKRLKNAGLKRINISLDSLNDKKLQKIAQKDVLKEVLEGIDTAIKEGFKIKLNSVILKGINDDEIIDLLEFAKKKKIVIRFIEFMENEIAYPNIKRVSAKEILEVIKSKYNFEKLEKNGVSEYYKLESGEIFGIIEPHKEDFCKQCNKIRLTAEGYLIPCLFFIDNFYLKDALRKKDFSKVKSILKKAVFNKPEKNDWQVKVSKRAFYETGG